MPTGNSAFVSLADVLRVAPTREAAHPEASRREASRAEPSSPETAYAEPSRPQPSNSERSHPENSAPGAAPPVSHLVLAPSEVDPAPEHVAALREARLFHAALADAFAAILADLLRELATDVVGRELRLAGVDIEGLARRLIAERAADGPLRLRVAPAQARVACDLPVVVDPTLQPGDAVLECRNGEIDARLSVRLERLLANVSA